MRKRSGFTLVEVMIAVVLSTIIAIVLMSVMTSVQTKTKKLTGRSKAAQDALVVLQKLKNVLRSSKEVSVSESGFSGSFSDGKPYEISYDGEREGISFPEAESSRDKLMGAGQIVFFEIIQPMGEDFPNIFKMTIGIENPEVNVMSEENHLYYSTIVSERIPQGDRIPDPSWVPNSQDLPASGDGV